MLIKTAVRVSWLTFYSTSLTKCLWCYDAKTRKWNGMIQDIISGKADISVDLTIRPALYWTAHWL